jgi:DNA mismatch repair protein MutL
MGIIRPLDEHLANQIAAGEVVERPASVLKELIENAVDAGSSRIDITTEEGGLTLVRVADDGTGIQPDDVMTAFQRHATSKIYNAKDLFQIGTLGFRGEALPSIAAVAKVRCASAPDGTGLARFVEIEGGSVKGEGETNASQGTEMIVRELFFNTPARLKYMKTIQTELGHLSDVVYRQALARPDIAFTFRHNGSVLLRTTGTGDLRQVVAAIYGTAAAKAMVDVKAEHPDYSLTGLTALPVETRANRNAVTVLVNGRYVRTQAVVQPLLQAYHTLLPVHRYPLSVLHLRMHPTLVDVNVHPAKLEVRFSKENELRSFIEQAVKEALGTQAYIPSAASVRTNAKSPFWVQDQIRFQVKPPDVSTDTAVASDPSGIAEVKPVYAPQAAGSRSFEKHAAGANTPSRPAASQDFSRPPSAGKVPESVWQAAFAAPAETPASRPEFPELTWIGQLHGTYLVTQNETGLYLIDQHAAHERIHYEYYYDKFGRPQEASQELLLPVTLGFAPDEYTLLRERLPIFESAGVYLEDFGGNTFMVRAVPHWFPEGDEADVVREIADWVLTERKIDLHTLREKAAILCSCKASIKANQALTREAAERLLSRLGQCRQPYTCPHGRPIVISFSTYELEKMFKRVM